MLADYAGITVPCFLLLNMSDVARVQGKSVDAAKLEAKLGIPVVPFSAPDKKSYDGFYKALNRALNENTRLDYSGLLEKYESIEAFAEVRELIPENIIPGYSEDWIAAKTIEGDAPVCAKVKEALDGATVRKIEERTASLKNGVVVTGECKFAWIDSLL